MFIYSYQQHDHLLPGNDRMLVIGSSALAKNHGHLKSSRLAADTLIFNFPLNHPRLWRQMEHSLSGARYSIILFMWPPLHLSPANGRLMEKPPEGGGPMESAEDMLCRLFAFLRKQTRRLILLSSPPSGPRVPGRENSRTAPAPSLRPAGTAKGTGMPEKPPRTMKRTNERKPPNYFPCGEKRLPPAKIPAPAFKDFRFSLLQITDIPFPA